MVSAAGLYVSDAIENRVGHGKFQLLYVAALCLAHTFGPIHTYSNMFASREQTWHRSCVGSGPWELASNSTGGSCTNGPLTSPADCAVPLDEWEADVPGRSIVGDFKLECERHGKIPLLGLLYFVGYAVGVLVSGSICDMIGRRWAYLLGYAVIGVGGFLAPLASSWTVYACARIMLGAGVASVGLSSYVWAMEFLSTSTRGIMSWLPSVAFSFGQILATPLAYFVPEWRPYLVWCQLLSLLGVTYWCFLRESPQWLASVGRIEEAHEVLCTMARTNGCAEPPPPPDDCDEDGELGSVSTASTIPDTSTGGSLRDLCDRRLRLRICIMCFNWFSLCFAFYGLSFFSPNQPFSIYTANVLSALVPMPFYVSAPMLVDAGWCGRKGAMVGSSFAGGVLLMLSTWCRSQWLSLTVFYAANGALSLAFAVLYCWSAELFPTDIRARCMSIQSVFARAGAMVSPFVVDLGRADPAAALCIVAAPCLVAGALDLLLPETRDMPLPASIDDISPWLTVTRSGPLKTPLLNGDTPDHVEGPFAHAASSDPLKATLATSTAYRSAA